MSTIQDLQRETGLKVPEDLINEDLLARLLDPSTRNTDLEQYDEDFTRKDFRNPIPYVYTKATPGPSPGSGTGLFTSKDIQPGETVMVIEKPFVAVLDTAQLETKCSGCLGAHVNRQEQVELKACTGCRVVKYCNKTCQAKDWKFVHSLECRIFQKLRPRVLPNNARAILRMVMLSESGRYPAGEMELFKGLESHLKDLCIRNANGDKDQWERVLLTAKAVRNYSGCAMDESLIVEYAAKLDVNSFNFDNIMGERLGIYMHPYAALMNHSCDYNSTVSFDNDSLYVKALRPIKKGEQIFITYVDTTNSYKIRQKELLDRYYFTCQCSKCQQGANSREDIVLGNSQDQNMTDHLQTLGFKVLNAISTTTEGGSKHESEASLSNLQQTMGKMSGHAWPITRQPLAAMRDELITCLLFQGLLHTALLQALIRYRLIDPILYPDVRHPVRQLHAWAVATIAINLAQPHEPNPRETITFEREMCALIAHSVLYQLMDNLSDGCTVPSFKKIVRRAFEDVAMPIYRNILRAAYGNLVGMIRSIWKQIDTIIASELKRERGGN